MKHPVVTALLFTLAACAATTALPDVQPPLPAADAPTAYAAASRVELPATAPEEHDGLHNVYRLSEHVVSGSEPESEEALAKLAAMGVKTILSVDGKEPDHEAAARYGLRYVHVPIRYSGLEDDELLAIAKTFRELDGPFYVHCFHGKHRGPAAAAVGRVVLDGVGRDQAIAEMRQWCGTSSQYEGLYAEVAFGALPSAAETAAYDFDFAPTWRIGGFQQGMVELARSWDVIAAQSQRDWAPDPAHPDASARNEAAKLADLFAQARRTERTGLELEEFGDWLEQSAQHARELAEHLAAYESGDAAAGERARQSAAQLEQLCTTCHEAYRN